MSNRIGFGGGVPKEEVYNEALVTIPPKPKYRFGQSTIDKLHVRHIPPAKILISVSTQAKGTRMEHCSNRHSDFY